ncbi:cupin domain-containing protein [Vibrio parahaemolyticus]|uniref:cupin domain-containing protein n=1 Tax=Vibrio parahaemolyticus TaxID=670 RepID=UPI001EECAE54|nr:cupin domain-containing protein [Vibrio parahaemolyticus]MCG6467188.1 cupin domain-containing protein [Vibrio parahaemolyticus]MCG6489722.1 cupin domain-containing protein [Vibrio parahaemolyticus]
MRRLLYCVAHPLTGRYALGGDLAVVSVKNSEHYQWGEQCDGWHLVKSQNLSVIQERVPPGCSEVRHLHKKSEQFFFVISGCATLEVNGETFELLENQGFHVPSNTPHQLSNRGQTDLHFVVTSTPPSHGDRVEIRA